MLMLQCIRSSCFSLDIEIRFNGASTQVINFGVLSDALEKRSSYCDRDIAYVEGTDVNTWSSFSRQLSFLTNTVSS